MRLLSVLWRPRRSFWQGLAYIKRARRWRTAGARTRAAASEGFEARWCQRARAVMGQTLSITAYKLSSLMPPIY